MEFEYRTNKWEMWLEGTSDKKPIKDDIKKHANSNGYKVENINISFDHMQKFWRFNADLKKITK
jgi:hypothetical protein